MFSYYKMNLSYSTIFILRRFFYIKRVAFRLLAAMAVVSNYLYLHKFRTQISLQTNFFPFLHTSSYSFLIDSSTHICLVTDNPQDDTNTDRNSPLRACNSVTGS